MKNYYVSLAVAASVFMLASCAEKKKTENIIAPKPEVKAPSGPVKMQSFNHKENVEWAGKKYTVAIQRNIDESSPVFTDETGGKYYDNRITLTVKSPEGADFFKREFTKQSFSQFIDAAYMKKSTILGIAVDHADEQGIVFVASVGCPDQLSDDFIPITMTLSRSGNLSMKKGQDIGTSNDPNAEEEGV